MRPVYLAGVGHTRFGRREEDYLSLADEAYEAAGRPPVDHLVVTSQEPGGFAGVGNVATAVADRLALRGVAATRVEAAPASGLAGLEVAQALVGSGLRDRVLVLGVEKMTGLSTEEANRVLAQMAHPSERELGLSMAGGIALMTRAYLETYGHDVSLLDAAAAKAHGQGALNRYAQFQKAYTAEEISQTPMVADPLRRNHCAPMSDGAACVLVTAEPGPVRVMATGHATDTLALTHRRGERAVTHFAATRRAAEEAFRRAGIDIQDVDLIETHDAFAFMEGINLEDLGLYPPGEGLPAVAAGETNHVNRGGGLKARGHPVGATGVAMVAELYWQLSRSPEVANRQVPEARIGLGHNMGGLGNNVVVAVLEAVG